MSIVKTICGMCGNDSCGVELEIQDNRIVRVRGNRGSAMNQGRLCPQSQAAVELSSSPDRLSHPLRRDGNGWQRISWDEALDEIVAGMQTIKATYGAHAFTIWEGEPMCQFSRDGWARRLLHLFGSPTWTFHDHLCQLPSVVAEKLTYGQVQIDGFEIEHTKCVVLWGSNPVTSHAPYQWSAVLAAKRRGVPLIVVDPRLSEPAKKADLHLAIRPGADGALALGLIHLIIAENLYDADFVAHWTHGFDALRERALPYTPERVAGITGLNADDIRRFARMYAGVRPAFLDVGNALEHHTNSSGALRALVSLRALTGNLDVPGGDVLMRDLPLDTMALPEMLPAGMRVLGSERYPLYSAFAGFAIGDVLMEAITTGQPHPVRGALVMGTNPALSYPNSTRLRQALDSLDLLVVSDMFMSATARHAHIVLPIASPYERTQLLANCAPFGADQPQWWIALRPQVLDPGERRSDWWVLRELAKRLGYGDYYPWESEEEAIDSLLEPTGLTVADLKANPDGVKWGAPAEFGSYQREGFRTPTGKVEFFSTIMASYGYDPLPNYEEPTESPISAPEMAKQYPLILNAGYRTGFHTNTRIEHFPGQRHHLPEPFAELQTATARQYGIADGDLVLVETPIGRVTVKARVVEEFVPGVVGILQGWEEANANLLTNDRLTDPVFSTPALRSALCRIQRVG